MGMKKMHVALTLFTLVISLVVFDCSVFAQDTAQTRVSIGFTTGTEVNPSKPEVVPPNGGDHSTGTTPKPPHTTGRLPQTGELINYWLLFNGILLLIMMLFIFGISKQKDDEKDIYLV